MEVVIRYNDPTTGAEREVAITGNSLHALTHGLDSATGLPAANHSHNNAQDVYETGQIGGERNPTSQGNNYTVIRKEASLTVVNKQTAVAIGIAANDTHLLSIEFVKALVGTCVITGFADDAAAAASITYPAASPAGVHDFDGALNSAGPLTVTCSNASDALQVLIRWRPVV